MPHEANGKARAEFYLIPSGKLLAGNYPAARDDEELRGKMRDFLRRGITAFVDLTEEGEAHPYQPFLEQEAGLLRMSVVHRRMPIPDNNAPSVAGMRAILDEIDGQIAAGRLVYVHCLFGLGRTATVFGCYLARHGLGGGDALKELVRLQQNTRFEGMTSPESQKQREMVANWPVGR